MHTRRGRHTRRHDERRDVDVEKAEGAKRNAKTRDLRNAKTDQPQRIRRRYNSSTTGDYDPLPPYDPCDGASLGCDLSRLATQVSSGFAGDSAKKSGVKPANCDICRVFQNDGEADPAAMGSALPSSRIRRRHWGQRTSLGQSCAARGHLIHRPNGCLQAHLTPERARRGGEAAQPRRARAAVAIRIVCSADTRRRSSISRVWASSRALSAA